MIMNQHGMTVNDIDQAIRQYIETALWSETDDDGEPLDTETDDRASYNRWSIDLESRRRMATDVRDFVAGCEAERPDVFNGMDPEQVGHDFWLTRNGHGTGFWDRDLGERGSWLTEQCKPHGEASLYVGDDGRLYYE
jgi:hypothetical protein